jgi:hypothetical protein
MSVEAYGWCPSRATLPVIVVDVGWRGETERRRFYEFLAEPGMGDHPAMIAMQRRSGREYVATRQEMVDDATWYGAATTSEERYRFGLDHFLMSSRILPGEGTDQFVLHRPPKARTFNGRESSLLRLFHGELARLWRQHATSADPIAALPPHLRDTLRQLLCGRSEKEASIKLGLSPHTVHSYVKELHRREGVASRSELLLRFAKRRDFLRRLTGAPPPG